MGLVGFFLREWTDQQKFQLLEHDQQLFTMFEVQFVECSVPLIRFAKPFYRV